MTWKWLSNGREIEGEWVGNNGGMTVEWPGIGQGMDCKWKLLNFIIYGIDLDDKSKVCLIKFQFACLVVSFYL